MGFVLRIPLRILVRVLRESVALVEAVAHRDAPVSPPATPAPAAPIASRAAAPAAPALTADEALERRFTREAAAAPVPDYDAEPPPASAAARVDAGDDVELVASVGPADDVSGTIVVQEPWPGYDEEPAKAVVARLRGADPATKAVVRLYEQQRKARATVLRATGGTTKP